MKKSFIILSIALLSFLGKNSVFSAQMDSSSEQPFKITPSELKWQSNPSLPKEILVSILYGDPNKDGPLVMRLKLPAGSKIAPHWHKVPENVTVLSGSLNIASGDKLDLTKGINLPVGSFVNIPPKHHHYAWVTEDTILQINNFGIWEIYYVNPQDDPRNQ